MEEVTINASGSISSPESVGSWPRTKKGIVLAISLILVTITTLASSLPSGVSRTLIEHFSVVDTNQRQVHLPVAVFLIGYIFGPMLFGPLSETSGRKISLLSSFAIYFIFTMACALAPNWSSFLVFRFLVGFGAAAPPTVLGGLFSDLYPCLKSRGRSMMLLGITTNVGPLLGPILSGHITQFGWQWMFWANFIIAGSIWPGLLWLPETYEPVLLRRRGVIGPKATHEIFPEGSVVEPHHSSIRTVYNFITKVLLRPIRMFTEPIVLFTDLFIVLLYGTFFLFFEVYPFIFRDIYHMSIGNSALAFLPATIGAFVAGGIFLWYDGFLEQSREEKKPWAMHESARRLPLVCVGGPIFSISLFWLGWTARSNIHWIVPVLSGLPNGIGIELLFMGLTNYLTDTYGIYSASVMASCVLSRNVVTVLLLPLATHPLYRNLGIAWACSLLGFISLGMSGIPFLFLRYGSVWRERSPFCRRLQEEHQIVILSSVDHSSTPKSEICGNKV